MSRELASVGALKAFIRDDDLYDTLDVTAFSEDVQGDSDRATIILFGAWTEDELMRALLAKMRPAMSSAERKGLFGPDRPLGTFSAKINLGYALQLYEKGMRADLDILREMRNACAHSRIPLSFKTPQLITVVHQLSTLKPNTPSDPKRHKIIRKAFVVACMRLMLPLLQTAEALKEAAG